MDQKPLGVVEAAVRLLTFRLSQEEFARLDRRHLAFGLTATWLAGMGRYWDHQSAHLLQYAGLGSVIYVLVLSLFLWLLIWPLKPENWGYARVLTFVTMTAPPALLYAIPVERFMTLVEAQQMNLGFLLIVAAWRVALLWFFLRRSAQLPVDLGVVASLLPLALVVGGLALANLEHAVFEIMAGLREPGTSADAAYAIVVLLAAFSWFMSPLLLIFYLISIYLRHRKPGPRDPPTTVKPA